MSDQFYKIRNKLKREQQSSQQPKPGRFDRPLSEEFGVAPDAEDGDRWVIFEKRFLIISHPTRGIRIYRSGGKGRYTEVVPNDDGRVHVRRT